MNPSIERTDFGVFIMKGDSHLSKWVIEHQRLDVAAPFLERFRHLIPEGGTVIDCGTCIGDHMATYANWVGPNGTVIGFEPNPDVAECCALNMGIYPWARVFNVGLSDKHGVAALHREVNVGASFLMENEGREVMLAPLDDYTKELIRLDFIKVDVEGFEPKLLAGAKETLKRFSPHILMEVNPGCLLKQGKTPTDIYARLAEAGYKWVVADGQEDAIHHEILASRIS